jgi:H+/Cl- antiporter ClcA
MSASCIISTCWWALEVLPLLPLLLLCVATVLQTAEEDSARTTDAMAQAFSREAATAFVDPVDHSVDWMEAVASTCATAFGPSRVREEQPLSHAQ